MPNLGEDIQIVLQTEADTGRFSCEGFSGIPIINPLFVVIATNGMPLPRSWAERLRQNLISSIQSLGGSAVSTEVPCSGSADDAFFCHAHHVSKCRKLLILVGDSSNPFPDSPPFSNWLDGGSSYIIFPIFPDGSKPSNLLPPPIQRVNSAFWRNSIVEIIPSILSIAGITANDYRIFVSYTRSDTAELADQLFDALSRENFDVYLDRFRTPPSIDFGIRIEQELHDKSMVMVLESPNILQSTWVQHEIRFAKRHRLGLIALQAPKGSAIPGIYPERREVLTIGDFDPITGNQLSSFALDRVLGRIKKEHGIAFIRRREFLKKSMRIALQLEGISNIQQNNDGLLRVQSTKSSSTVDYGIWLTPRTLDLPDFQLTDTSLRPPEKGIVIGPAIKESMRQERIRWLSGKSMVSFFEEGQMRRVAQEIAWGRI